MNWKLFGRNGFELIKGVISAFVCWSWRKSRNIAVNITSFRTDVRTEHLGNVISKRYLYTNRLGLCTLIVRCRRKEFFCLMQLIPLFFTHWHLFSWSNISLNSVEHGSSQELAIPGATDSSPQIHPLDIILILFSHLHLGLTSGFFPSGSPTKTVYVFLICPLRLTHPCRLISLHSITPKSMYLKVKK
jgi:hypothetical protein